MAVVGLGDIARKAYLPVLATRPDLHLHLVTRNEATLAELGDAYRIRNRSTRIAEALATGLGAAFVHTATPAHAGIVAELLEAGVPVYCDKPLDASFAGAQRLTELAASRGIALMTGFNRRYAPVYTALLGQPRDVVIMQKNRSGLAAAPRSVAFDDFIHVADTLRFLAPGPVTGTSIEVRTVGGLLEHVVLRLSGAGYTAIGVMSRVSGSAEESVEVIGGGHKRRVTGLAEVTDYGPALAVTRRGDWTPVSRQRGIEQACEAFLAAVRRGDPLTAQAQDALETHRICEDVVTACGSPPA
ncbi:MAG: virulence factor [Cryptosporangiaceae bacterium]|nr:virulence factor [Cryptosporangiaceae bacterium]